MAWETGGELPGFHQEGDRNRERLEHRPRARLVEALLGDHEGRLER
jgi:hypothetical protein